MDGEPPVVSAEDIVAFILTGLEVELRLLDNVTLLLGSMLVTVSVLLTTAAIETCVVPGVTVLVVLILDESFPVTMFVSGNKTSRVV